LTGIIGNEQDVRRR